MTTSKYSYSFNDLTMGFTGTYHGDIRPSTKLIDIFDSTTPPNHYFVGDSTVIPITNPLDSYINGLTIKIVLRTIDQSKTILEVFNENKVGDDKNILVLMQQDDVSIDSSGKISFQITKDDTSTEDDTGKFMRLNTYYTSTTSNVLEYSTNFNDEHKASDYSILSFAISTRKTNRTTTPLDVSLPNDIYTKIRTNMYKVSNDGIVNKYKPVFVAPYLFDKISHIYLLKGFVAEVYIEDNYYTSETELTHIVDNLREECLKHIADENFRTSYIDLKSDISRSIEHINRITDKYHISQNIEIFGRGTNHADVSNVRSLPFSIPNISYDKSDRVGNTFIFQLKPTSQNATISSATSPSANDIRLFTLSKTGLETASSVAINIRRENNIDKIGFAVYPNPVNHNNINWSRISGYGNSNVLSIVLSKSIGILGTRYFISGLTKNSSNNTYAYKQTEPLFADNWTDIIVSKGAFVRNGLVCRILVLPFVDDDIDLKRVVQKYAFEYIDMPVETSDTTPIMEYPSQEQSYRMAIKNRLDIINNEEYSMDYILELLTT